MELRAWQTAREYLSLLPILARWVVGGGLPCAWGVGDPEERRRSQWVTRTAGQHAYYPWVSHAPCVRAGARANAHPGMGSSTPAAVRASTQSSRA